MPANKWTIVPMEVEGDEEEEEDESMINPAPVKVTRITYAFRRLDALMVRVKTRIEEGKECLDKIQKGENIAVDGLILDKFALAINGFTTELRGVDQREECLHTEKWDEYTQVQLEAEDLLLTLKRINKDRKQEEGQNSRPNLNIMSRLPKMDLQKFDGNKLKWFEFWGRFKSSVDRRQDLSDIDKLSYLLGLLEGEAKEVVEGLDITDAAYSIAVDALTQQFGRPDIVVDAHYEAVSDIAPACDNTKECRKVLNDIERHLKVLKTLGEDVDKNNQLRHMIPKKFPQSIRYDLSMTMREKENTVANLRQALAEVITARETSQFKTFEKRSPSVGQSFTTETLLSADAGKCTACCNGGDKRKASSESQPSTQLFSQGNSSTRPRGPPPNKRSRIACAFCGESHYSDRCNKYPSVKERQSKLKNRCFICLGTSHRRQNCPASSFLCAHCKKTGHHRSLCYANSNERNTEQKQQQPQQVTSTFCSLQSDSILQTALVNVHDATSNQSVPGRILFDTGSQRSYVTTEIVQKLKTTPIEHTCLSVYTFGQPHPKNIESQLVRIEILVPQGSPVEIYAYVIPSITGVIPSFREAKDGLRRLNPNLELAEDVQSDSKADVLIGNDHYHSFFTGQRKRIQGNLYVIQSKFGWIPSGCNNQENKEILSMITYVQERQVEGNKCLFTIPDPPLRDDNIREIWELESIGIRDSPKVLQEDEIVKFFNQTTTFENNRYQVKWPWVQYPTDLPVNYGMALGRLTGLINRIDRHTLEQYDSVLQDQLSKGVIEIVEEAQLPSHPVHYLPHHCVVQENKTTKLRVVYDASAKSKGHCSLNEYLYKGPRMLEDLVALLIRFREHPIGIIADVEKAFLQIALHPEDRDVVRFLWIKDTEKSVTEDNIVHFRFCRVPFGVISSPYLLAATIQYHLTRKHSEEADIIGRSLYVDNLVAASRSVEEGIKLFETAMEAFRELSMNIRGWCTNSAGLRELIPEEQRDASSSVVTVLGLKWNMIEDTLKLAVDPLIFVRNITSKREILRIVASVFDPCGYVSPLLLPARVFLQKLWIEKYKWDTPLGEEKIAEWNQCVLPLQFTSQVEIPRYHFKTTFPLVDDDRTRMELHCFTDASKDAYSAVVYLRKIQEEVAINIIMSRTRLTPVKLRDRMTIPKLELLGVLIGARLITYLRDTLGLARLNMFLWTDSQIVLRWTKSEKLLEPFVSRRIAEIRSFSSIQFRYVCSKENPADLATRVQFSPLPTLWLKGPKFLQLPNEDWNNESHFLQTHNCVSCNSSDSNKLTESITQENEMPMNEHPVGGDQVIEDFLAQDNIEDPDFPDEPEDEVEISPSFSEVNSIKKAQRDFYPKEMNGVETHLTKSLGLFVDEHGLLRCKGRLQNAMLPYDQKFPILLPKNHHFTLQTIKKVHEDNHHVGVSHTLASHRKRFWVPHGRSQVIAVLKRCKQCVKYGGGPYRLPAMPPLPAERVQYCRPFTYTGLDYLGPLTVLNQGHQQKRWCCLFTCMASRAIRLEIVNDLSAEEFLLSLRRFVATECIPALIVSDNAAQFKLAAEIIQSPLCSDNNVAWHFIPALSPWQGGFYERLVGLVKHCLRRTLDKNLLSVSQLTTVLKEIENILNSRPLTAVGEDLELVLSPADFMSSCGTHPLPVSGDDSAPNVTATKSNLISGWKLGQHVLNEFKVMFQDQYLARLRERAVTPHKQPRVLSKREPKVGDIVQLGEDRSKASNRAHWKVGRIAELITSADGGTRSARIKLETGQTVTRSVSVLYPLELSEDDDQLSDNPPQQNSVADDNEEPTPLNASASSNAKAQTPELTDDPPTESSHSTDLSKPQFQTSQDQTKTSRPCRETAKVARGLIRQWTQSLSSLMANTK